MLIHELARATGFSADTIRFYEKQGIVASPVRLANGYRDYPESTLACLKLCRRAKDLGFSLEEIRQLGRLLDAHRLDRATLAKRLTAKLKELDEKLADLARLRADVATALAELGPARVGARRRAARRSA